MSQGIAGIDLIRWGQTYVNNNTNDENLKERLLNAASNMTKLYISISTENIKRAIKENMEQAIFYDGGTEIGRLYRKEITHEEYENSPIKKAHDEYAGAIKFRVADLDLACILEAIAKPAKIPTYKVALNGALRHAQKHIKAICKETNCNAEIAAFITVELIGRICRITYGVYHQEEFDELQKSIDDYSTGVNNVMKLITQPCSDPKNDKYYKKRDELEKEFIEKQQKYSSQIYKINEVDSITEKIIKKIFPNANVINKVEGSNKSTMLLDPCDIYMKLPQGTHTNNLAHKLITKKTEVKKDLNGNGSVVDNDFKLYIEGYDKLVNGANISTVKLFDAFVINCSKNQDTLAKIPLKEYMELRELKDEKEARKQIKKDMAVLKSIKFEFKGTGKSKGDWINLSLYGGRDGIYKGIIEFRFTPEFYSSIPENQFMFIPREYFATKDKYNPYSSSFIRRVAEHKRMNLGKTNENIIGVETLINSTPTFPKYDDATYHFTQKILEPFERDLDALSSIKWSYTGEQPTNYNDFINSSIEVTWVDYPDTNNFIQKKLQPPKKKNSKKWGGNKSDLGG